MNGKLWKSLAVSEIKYLRDCMTYGMDDETVDVRKSHVKRCNKLIEESKSLYHETCEGDI